MDERARRELTSFHSRRGNAEKLSAAGHQAVDYFQSCLATDPQDQLARISLASVFADLEQWEDARETLLEAGDPQLHSTLAAVCVREFDAKRPSVPRLPADGEATSEAATEDQNIIDQLVPLYELLETAFHTVPNYRPAIDRLEWELLVEVGAGRDVLQHRLLDMLADGQQSAVVHRLLGVRASAAKDWATAVGHLEQAYRSQPQDAVLLNNLANALLEAKMPNTQIRRAETLANEALQLAPDHPEILATRGAIRVELERYQDAAADLERALEVLKGRPHLHLLLADCYDHVGLTSLAELHLKKACRAEAEADGI